MKRSYLKIQSVFLALMILVVSNSYAVTSHFCGTTLVGVSYFGKSKSCGMMPEKDGCKDEQTVKKDCCKDVVEIIEPEVLDKTTVFEFKTKEFNDVIYFALSYLTSFQEVNKEDVAFVDIPDPPDIDVDALVLYQTFLI